MNISNIYIYIIIIIAILGTMLFPGYIFLTDHIISPQLGRGVSLGGHHLILGILSQIFKYIPFGIMFLEKIFFAGAIFFTLRSGKTLLEIEKIPILDWFPALFLVFNPFFYARWMDGQSNVYRMLPMMLLWMVYLTRYLEQNNRKSGFLGVLSIALLAPMISVHAMFFMAMSGTIITIVYMIQQKSRQTLCKSILVALCGVCVNSYWILPSLTGSNEINGLIKDIESYDATHLELFQTDTGPINNIYINVALLHGFWGEKMSRFAPSYGSQGLMLYYLTGLFLLLVAIGIYHRKRKGDWNAWDSSTLVIMILAYILAMGTGPTIFSGFNQWLYDTVPMYAGFREPHKRILFVVIGYAYFGYWGCRQVLERVGDDTMTRYVLTGLPIIITPVILRGGAGQIQPKHYPIERETLQTTLTQSILQKSSDCERKRQGSGDTCYDILNLPRHTYISPTWVGRLTLNPAANYFKDSRILSAQNYEMGPLYSTSQQQEITLIDRHFASHVLLGSFDQKQVIFDLKTIGLSYIVLQKDVDWKLYEKKLSEFVVSGFLKKMEENDVFIMYKIEY